MLQQVQLTKLSGDVAASWELPGSTLLTELQPLAEAALAELSCKTRLLLLLPDGRLVRDLDDSLESLL